MSMGFGSTAVNVRSSSSSEPGSKTWPVIRMIGTEGQRVWSQRARPRPSRLGIARSVTTNCAAGGCRSRPAPRLPNARRYSDAPNSSATRQASGGWARDRPRGGHRVPPHRPWGRDQHRNNAQHGGDLNGVRSVRTVRDLGPGQSEVAAGGFEQLHDSAVRRDHPAQVRECQWLGPIRQARGRRNSLPGGLVCARVRGRRRFDPFEMESARPGSTSSRGLLAGSPAGAPGDECIECPPSQWGSYSPASAFPRRSCARPARARRSPRPMTSGDLRSRATKTSAPASASADATSSGAGRRDPQGSDSALRRLSRDR